MALIEKNIIDKIEVLDSGVLQIRQANIIEKDGVQVAKTFIRWTLFPGQDLTGQDIRVVNIANTVWTPDVIAAYQAKISSSVPQ